MKLFDDLIARTEEILAPLPRRFYPAGSVPAWRDAGENFVLLGRETALEMGAAGSGCCACLVTENKDAAGESGVEVVGSELSKLSGSAPYARIAVALCRGVEEGSDEAYKAVQSVDFVKYRVFPEGYMLRVSAEGGKEAVRVSKSAKKEGISFARVGQLYLQKYLQVPHVEAVKLIFVTDGGAVKALAEVAKQAKARTRALNKILKSGMLDCAACALKPVCDEVDELKELHFGRARAEGDKK